MGSQNASDWMNVGRKKGILLDFMYQDKSMMYTMLQELGLPYPPFHIFKGSEMRMDAAASLFQSGKSFFCRLVPRNPAQERPYCLRLTSQTELEEFLLPYHLDEYKEMQLVEKPEVFYTGSIIAQDQAPGIPGKCVVELVPGDGPNLFHGKRIPLTAFIEFGLLTIAPGTISLERTLIYQALNLVGGLKHPFPGYYEFEVWKENEIKFRNYQSPTTAYAQL